MNFSKEASRDAWNNTHHTRRRSHGWCHPDLALQRKVGAISCNNFSSNPDYLSVVGRFRKNTSLASGQDVAEAWLPVKSVTFRWSWWAAFSAVLCATRFTGLRNRFHRHRHALLQTGSFTNYTSAEEYVYAALKAFARLV